MATPTPYIERHDGDLIQAEAWNDIRIQARTELQSHNHSGGEQGTNISYTNLADVPQLFPPVPHHHTELQSHDHSGEEQGTNISYTNLANRPPTFPPAPHHHGGEDLTIQDLRIGGRLQVDAIDPGNNGSIYYHPGSSRHKPGLWLTSGPDDNRSSIMMNADTIKIWTPLNEPFSIYDEDNNRPQLQLHNNGNLSLRGQLRQGCSREFKENIQTLSAEEAMTTMEHLRPVKYDLKQTKAFRQHLGFIAEDLPDNIASDDRKSIAPSEIVAVLTQVVREQQKTIASLQTTVSRLEEDVQRLRTCVMPR